LNSILYSPPPSWCVSCHNIRDRISKRSGIGKIEFPILIAPGSIYTFNAKSNNEIDVYGFVSVVSATAGNSTKPNKNKIKER
jgi:hypothetical protein